MKNLEKTCFWKSKISRKNIFSFFEKYILLKIRTSNFEQCYKQNHSSIKNLPKLIFLNINLEKWIWGGFHFEENNENSDLKFRRLRQNGWKNKSSQSSWFKTLARLGFCVFKQCLVNLSSKYVQHHAFWFRAWSRLNSHNI